MHQRRGNRTLPLHWVCLQFMRKQQHNSSPTVPYCFTEDCTSCQGDETCVRPVTELVTDAPPTQTSKTVQHLYRRRELPSVWIGSSLRRLSALEVCEECKPNTNADCTWSDYFFYVEETDVRRLQRCCRRWRQCSGVLVVSNELLPSRRHLSS
jgi:hypothetical protein